MRAVVFDDFGRRPEVRGVEDPAPAPHGAVIRVEATGLCRSDWHGWMGHDPDIRLPHVPGHELAGVIEEVGPDVVNWRPGQRVTVPFVCACGRCAACAEGAQQVCERQTQPGFTHWGSFAEYVAIENADVNLVGIRNELSFTTAAGLGCRFATAFRAVVAQGQVAPGEWVAVHGCGGVGLSAVMIAAAAGARVVAVDISPRALALAARFGAAVCVDVGSTLGSVAEAVADATGGGAHVSLDALGSPRTCAASIKSLRRHGRHVQVGLLPPAAGTPMIPMDRVIALELRLLGSHGMAAHDYAPMMAMVEAGSLRPDLLVTDVIGLDAVPEALSTMASGARGGVTVIEPHRPPVTGS
ncbi:MULTISPECIES: zinc-dependent alcohol dehydrogenase family protein [Streptomyces]|uniref:2-deoxy-scyllo-inosamine dehydrogenase n=1 Tax=Streptomyces autolyticus TaxID=75293 RepID=A0ABM6HMN7_9ACTN|nr:MULTISPECIES: zinc-dependent alcohol dehydrogenase family protein [Streptomyces]AQA15493.1 alcohol dehydrogenase [Streptomyces autolyticus]MCD9589813.1 zinc-dependent alcohol dehydrogenase family protein [Streptomyces sp. 8ZJF_21]MCQ6247694.1 zinc-dependent alcohol dehydrogenase family protein [Streptomyces malaysiensis]